MPQTVEVCRLCLSKERLMLPIFNSYSKSETPFRTKIMSCASIEIFADDNLPSKICYVCVHQVEKFFMFQTLWETSDMVLRSQLKENKALSEVEQDDKKIFTGKVTGNESEMCSPITKTYLSNSSPEGKLNLDALTCTICSTVFLTNTLYIDHLIKSHPDLNLLFCKSCKISFSHINQYKNHLSLQHSLTCNHCDFVFKHEKSLKDHLKIHLMENLACRFCGKTFKNLYEIKKHELLHFEKTCNFCSKELVSKNDYNSHFQNCVQEHCCQFCKESFKLKKDLIEHVNSHHDSRDAEKCDDSQDSVVANEVQGSKCDSEDDQSFECRNCQIQCKDELSLVNHITTEHNNALLICRFCGKKFDLRSSLKRHERSHSGVKPYQCKFCPRKFKDSSACVVHTRTHTGEHPFRCEECHKDFKQLANLKMHTYRHHKKNKCSVDVGSEILNETGNGYDHLYAGVIMGNYSGGNMRGYQDLNETIPANFNQDITILIPDHHPT